MGSTERYSPHNQTTLNEEDTGGVGKLEILHPPGTFALTPASRIAMRAIGQHQQLLAGNGIDWGCGTGCLAIAAAKIERVKKVVGLDISALNVETARQNAVLNGVADKTAFFLSNSYVPSAEADRHTLHSLFGQINFILANAPSSEEDDGFEFRRMVLKGARPYLAMGGVLFLNVSYQYGRQRVVNLSQQIPGFNYGGVLASTDWVPFDLQRPDLLHCLELYAEEERRGGLEYVFVDPDSLAAAINAQTALARFRQSGLMPLTQWQTHLFTYVGE